MSAPPSDLERSILCECEHFELTECVLGVCPQNRQGAKRGAGPIQRRRVRDMTNSKNFGMNSLRVVFEGGYITFK
jgi:hypothetical protein